MCLAIPGKVVEWMVRGSSFASARVEFDGVRREVSMLCVPEASVGDYVLVHAGIAISVIDAGEATRTLAEIARWKSSSPPESEAFDPPHNFRGGSP